MSAIYPSAALKNQQQEIKARADTQAVHIAESGRDKYVFMSEEVFERVIDQAVEDALYERRLADAPDTRPRENRGPYTPRGRLVTVRLAAPSLPRTR